MFAEKILINRCLKRTKTIHGPVKLSKGGRTGQREIREDLSSLTGENDQAIDITQQLSYLNYFFPMNSPNF